jgi:scyllo-inositol 2-dehydrogenase (NAD+)
MLTAAVVGCGRMGAEPSERLAGSIPAGWLPISHAECLQLLPGVRLSAFVDVDATKLARHGEHYGVTSLYTDFRLMLQDVRPQLLTIATRTPEKASIIKHACNAGVKALYIEKPIANSLGDCRDVLLAATNAGVVVGYGVNRRYHAVYRQARQMLLDGVIGDVVDINFEFGRSQLLWTHPHVVDLLLFLLGRPKIQSVQAQFEIESVSMLGANVIDSDPIVEHAHFVCDGGVRGTIARAGGCTLRIGGSAGTLTVHGDGAFIQVSRDRGRTQTGYFLDQEFAHPIPTASATQTAFRELIESVKAGTPPAITINEIQSGLHILLACAWSHINGGSSVRLKDVPEDLVVTGKYRNGYA